MYKILMAAYPFPPYEWAGGASIRLVKYLKYIAQLRPQWEIDVVTAGYGPKEAKMLPQAADLLEEVPAENINIHRITDPAYIPWPQASLPRRAMAKLIRPLAPELAKAINPPPAKPVAAIPDNRMGWNQMVLGWARQQQTKYNIVYASCPPYSTAVLGAELKEIFDCPLVVDIKDNWITARKKLDDTRKRIEEQMELETIKAADACICVTPETLGCYKEYYEDFANKFHLITNGVDLADFGLPSSDSGQAREKFSITYAGSLGGENRSPENFFIAMKQLLDCEGVDPLKCEILFPASMPEKFWQMGADLGLAKNLVRAEVVDRDKYVQRLQNSQVLLSINYYNEKTLIPGKLYEYWAAGRPVFLIEKPGAATALVKRYDLGKCADLDSVGEIFDCLWEFWLEFNSGENFIPRAAGLAQFSREHLSGQLCQLFEALLTF